MVNHQHDQVHHQPSASSPAVYHKAAVRWHRHQADVVLLSFVRANSKRRLGFLTEFRRLNVALTRAKQSLIVAGAATWGDVNIINHRNIGFKQP